MYRKTYHAVPNLDGRWNLKKGGGERAVKHFDKKSDAIDYGRDGSRNQETEFLIHGKDGKIQTSDSLGNDQNSPKNKDTH